MCAIQIRSWKPGWWISKCKAGLYRSYQMLFPLSNTRSRQKYTKNPWLVSTLQKQSWIPVLPFHVTFILKSTNDTKQIHRKMNSSFCNREEQFKNLISNPIIVAVKRKKNKQRGKNSISCIPASFHQFLWRICKQKFIERARSRRGVVFVARAK